VWLAQPSVVTTIRGFLSPFTLVEAWARELRKCTLCMNAASKDYQWWGSRAEQRVTPKPGYPGPPYGCPHHTHSPGNIIQKSWILLSATLRGSIRFSTSGFTSFWTLSSKFFATFPHGTCLLSVLLSYLVLGGVYLPICIAFSSNITLSAIKASNWHFSTPYSATGLAPSLGREPFSKGLTVLAEIVMTLTITQHRF